MRGKGLFPRQLCLGHMSLPELLRIQLRSRKTQETLGGRGAYLAMVLPYSPSVDNTNEGYQKARPQSDLGALALLCSFEQLVA